MVSRPSGSFISVLRFKLTYTSSAREPYWVMSWAFGKYACERQRRRPGRANGVCLAQAAAGNGVAASHGSTPRLSTPAFYNGGPDGSKSRFAWQVFTHPQASN